MVVLILVQHGNYSLPRIALVNTVTLRKRPSAGALKFSSSNVI
jgi:hypothetical protein